MIVVVAELVVPSSVEEAVQVQVGLAPRVERAAPAGFAPLTATGVDVAYAVSEGGPPVRVAAAAVTIELGTGAVVESATAVGECTFPYVPGLFAFRELPAVLDALAGLDTAPELLVADGHGIAHPRRFGLASHLGVLTGTPCIGVAKTPIGSYDPPGRDRGAAGPLCVDGVESGAALRTRTGVKPVFVSIGHRIDLTTACQHVLTLCRGYRLPETTRLADRLSRHALTKALSAH